MKTVSKTQRWQAGSPVATAGVAYLRDSFGCRASKPQIHLSLNTEERPPG
jgi:hypothetical protein